MRWLRAASIVLFWVSGCRLAVATDGGSSLISGSLNRTDWPDALNSQASIDKASRAEVLMFGKALLASEALDESGLAQQLGVPQVHLNSITQVRDDLWNGLLTTYRNASQSCDDQAFCARVRSVSDLRQLAAGFTGDISPAHTAWASQSLKVHEQLLNEQLRVAVLQP